MKTSKQLTQEVLAKIAAHKEKQALFRKRAGRAAACCLIAMFLVPSIVFLSAKDESQRNSPISKPYENEQSSPVDRETSESDSTKTAQNGVGMYEIDALI